MKTPPPIKVRKKFMKVIVYTRASTKDQKLSHAAQQEKIKSFVDVEEMEIVASYQDTASGTDNEREGLKKAMAHAKKLQAPIVILRICRLSRRLSFFASLLEDPSLNFIFAENGKKADPFVLNIMACVAEQERKLISTRTKEALAALKASGVKLGNINSLKVAREQAARANREKGKATKQKYAAILTAIKNEGVESVKGTARRLTELGIPTPTGKKVWGRTTTRRLMNA